MARYKVTIKPSAAREIEGIGSKKDRARIVRRIEALAHNPRPTGCEKLAGSGDRYRIRQGRYRILYTVAHPNLVLDIVKVGHRKEVYR